MSTLMRPGGSPTSRVPSMSKLIRRATRAGPENVLRRGERHDGVEPRLISYHTRDVALSGEIFCQHHVTGRDPGHRPVAYLDLRRAGQRDRILPARSAMPIE